MNELAEKIKEIDCSSFRLPMFKGELKEFQKKGIVWMYYAKKGLLADQCGLGKTIEFIGLLLLLKKRGELKRAIVGVLNSLSAKQCLSEFTKFAGDYLQVGMLSGKSPEKRKQIYNQSYMFDVLITSHALIRNDEQLLKKCGYNVFILDEASAIKNHSTGLSKSVKQLTRCERSLMISATPAQNDATDLHSIFEAIDRTVLGDYIDFRAKFCIEEHILNKVRLPNGKITVLNIYNRAMKDCIILAPVYKIVGTKNVKELKETIKPYYLRRRVKDVETELPEVVVKDDWLDLTKEQKEIYGGLKTAALNCVGNNDYHGLKKTMHSLQQCVDGTGSLPGIDTDHSCKLDFIMDLLKGDLWNEKVVVFSFYRKTVELLQNRCIEAGIKSITIMGSSDKNLQAKNIELFKTNPEVNVCIGTTAMEMSLNLQTARFLLLIDRLYNPERMEQLLGRLRRIGSKHSSVIVRNLLTNGTVEKKIYDYIKGKKALPDYLFDESSDLFASLPLRELSGILQE